MRRTPVMLIVRVALKISVALLMMSATSLVNHSQGLPPPTAREPQIRTTITYCNFDLAKRWKLGNLSFNSLYGFTIDKEGKTLEIKKLRDDFIGEQAVRDCVSNWRIVGFQESSRFSVYFVWKHGKGWVRQEISGTGFSQIMTMSNPGIEQLSSPNDRKN
jgi:hypothetical protein